jgi:hypothetical protein
MAGESIVLDCPPAVFGDRDFDLYAETAAFKTLKATSAKWILSKNESVVAQKTQTVEIDADASGIAVKVSVPDVHSETRMRLDLMIGADSVSKELRVFPRAFSRSLFTAFKDVPIAAFDPTERTARMFKALGLKVESITSVEGLTLFKGRVLVIAGNGARTGIDFWDRLHDKIRAGMGVLVLNPGDLKIGSIEPQSLGQIDTKNTSVHTGRDMEALFQGFQSAEIACWKPVFDQSFRLPERGAFTVLLRTNCSTPAAAMLEFPDESGRMIVSGVDLLTLAEQDPVALTVLSNTIKVLSVPSSLQENRRADAGGKSRKGDEP